MNTTDRADSPHVTRLLQAAASLTHDQVTAFHRRWPMPGEAMPDVVMFFVPGRGELASAESLDDLHGRVGAVVDTRAVELGHSLLEVPWMHVRAVTQVTAIALAVRPVGRAGDRTWYLAVTDDWRAVMGLPHPDDIEWLDEHDIADLARGPSIGGSHLAVTDG